MQTSKPERFIVGLTGGIGSGKTVCSDHFASLGVPIIDTDVLARQIVEPGQPALRSLVEEFGEGILLANGYLDRGALRKIAFASDTNKNKLDSITHPAIRLATIDALSKVDYPYCIIVIPLLSESSAFNALLSRVLLVTADYETKIERVKVRSNLSRQEVVTIMGTQLSDSERIGFADDVIENDGSIQDAQLSVEQLHQEYLEIATA